MAVIGRLVAELSANSAAFKRDMGKATNTLRSSSAKMNRMLGKLDRHFNSLKRGAAGFAKSMFSLKGALGAAIGVGAAGGLILLIKKSIEAADEIAKTADVLGITTDALQEYRFAAALSGVESDKLDKAFKKFGVSVGEARAGTGTLITFLQKSDPAFLNTIKNTSDLTVALDLFFKKMASTEKQVDRLALAAAGFGARGGREMTVMVKNGIGSLTEMREEARKLGIILDETMLRQAEKANDALERMGRIVSVNVTRAMLALSPTIIRVGAAVAENSKAWAEFIESKLPDAVVGVNELEKRLAALQGRLAAVMAKPGGPLPFHLPFISEESAGEIGGRITALRALVAARKKADATLKFTETVAGLKAVDAKVLAVKESLRFQGDQLDRTAQKQAFFMALQRAGIDENHTQVGSIRDLIEVIFRKREADAAATKSAAARLAEEKKIAALVKSLRTPQEVYNDKVDELNKLYETGAVKAETYRRGISAAGEALKKINEDGKEASDIGQQLGLTFSSAFEDAITSGAKFGAVLKSIKQDLLKLFIRKAVTEPFAAGASTLFSSALSSIFGGFREGGGHVTAGKVFAVGEKGTELFKPDRPGTIIPNSALGGGAIGGGGNVYNIDARGADVGAVDRLSAALIALAGPGRTEQRAVAAVGKLSARNPRFIGA